MGERILKKEYRLLAIAIVFFLAGATLFFYDRRAEPAPTTPAPASQNNAALVRSPFKNYPEPRTFRHFSFAPGGTLPEVSATCSAAFIVALVFPADVDYRNDSARATFNRAFACAGGTSFRYSFSSADSAHMSSGAYYMIVADQKTYDPWYNPR